MEEYHNDLSVNNHSLDKHLCDWRVTDVNGQAEQTADSLYSQL